MFVADAAERANAWISRDSAHSGTHALAGFCGIATADGEDQDADRLALRPSINVSRRRNPSIARPPMTQPQACSRTRSAMARDDQGREIGRRSLQPGCSDATTSMTSTAAREGGSADADQRERCRTGRIGRPKRPAMARPRWGKPPRSTHRRLPQAVGARLDQASLPDTCPSIFEVWYSAMPMRLIRPSCCSSHQAWSSSVSRNCASSTSRLT